MRRMLLSILVLLPAFCFFAPPASAHPGQLGQEIVYLLTDCTAAGYSGSECFDNIGDLANFIGTGRNASAPLVVDIGPGTFSGNLNLACDSGKGYVTFRGVGRQRSILQGTSGFTLVVKDCVELGFQELTIQAPTTTSAGSNLGAVKWTGCGSSTYSDVDLLVRGATLTDENQNAADWWDPSGTEDGGGTCQAVHHWFGSRIFNEGDAATSFGIYSASDQHWFYGGEIKVQGSSSTPSPAAQAAVFVQGGDVRIYGSLVRAVVGGATNVNYNNHSWASLGFDFNAILAIGGIVHMHGGIVTADATGSSLPINVDGAEVHGAFAHILDTSYNLTPGPGGVATRLKSPGSNSTLLSAFQWPAGSEPPSVVSTTGSDTFIETDCGANGACDGGGNETHLMIYNDTACPSEKWFDSTTGRCRNDTGGS